MLNHAYKHGGIFDGGKKKGVDGANEFRRKPGSIFSDENMTNESQRNLCRFSKVDDEAEK